MKAKRAVAFSGLISNNSGRMSFNASVWCFNVVFVWAAEGETRDKCREVIARRPDSRKGCVKARVGMECCQAGVWIWSAIVELVLSVKWWIRRSLSLWSSLGVAGEEKRRSIELLLC